MGSIVAVPLTVALTLISTRPTDFPTFCKWLYSYLYIVISQLFTKKRFDLYEIEAHNDPFKVGFLPHPLEIELESPQPDAHLQNAADEIFFYGVNSKSESLIVRIARTVNHEAEAWIYMKLKDGKIYNLHKTMGYQNSCSDAGREFTCGGLKIHYISPMRRWRIFYNGLLRETSEVDPSIDKLRYVKFAFIWCASSDLFDMQTDVDSVPLALAIANSKWKSWQVPMKKLQDALNFYAQGGSIHGTISIDGDSSEHQIYLFGERIRFLGKTFLEDGAQFTHVLGQISKNGSIIHIGLATIPGIAKKLKFGFIVLPSGRLAPFSDVEMELENIHVDGSEDVRALFHANGLEFKVKGTLAGRLSRFESNKGWDGSLTMDWLNIELNQSKGSGILIKGRILKPSLRSIPTDYINEIPKVRPLLVHFSEESCEISELTGGKGSSLGKLTQLSKQYQNFIVPNGVVVTTSSYEAFVNSDIRREIKSLEDVLYGKTSGDVKEACKRVMDEVIKANMPDTVLQAVVKGLKKTFGEQMQSKKFAVRSSATGEDTEQMSAAGQMETYLGVSGLSEIVSSVKKCWASQFSFIAVQYKKQNGQIINSPMAVVIQEMIPCDVAGVLFTCDPLTGNPTRMTITANYGLGESVVSGSEEPDTIELTKNERDELEITNKIIGSKAHRIVVRDDEGTTLQEVSEKEKSACCLSDMLALRLGNIAIHIEKSYRSNRDIEWGFWNNNLYIFQSRPVTSGTGETDYEIDHERDGPLRIDSEYFCVCNVGEVMPGATSPLGIDIIFKYFNIAFQRRTEAEWQSELRPVYFSKGLIHMYYHVMFYCLDLFQKISEGRKVLEATMIGLFGRVLDDEDLFDIALERYGTTTVTKQGIIGKYYRLTKALFNSKSRLEKALKFYANYHVPVEKQKTSREVFDTLMHACDEMTEAMTCHMLASQSSSMWNMIIMSVIEKARGGGIGPEVYRDFSKLLSSISEVESADVPSAMQSLAYHIGKEINPEDFKKMNSELHLCNGVKEGIVATHNATFTVGSGDPNYAVDIMSKGSSRPSTASAVCPLYIPSTTAAVSPPSMPSRPTSFAEILQRLKTSPTEAGIKFRDFLEKHGHRCLKEFDVRSVTWGKDPKLLIQLLQNLVGNVKTDSSPKKIENLDQILNDLGVSMKASTRFLLKYLLLPQCRKAVQTRERSKSLMIKLLDDWRKGYVYLSKVMTLEGRIPEEDIMFFMNLEELSELINTRSPKIISIANHRRRRFPILDKYIFPEIMKGVPKPINMDDTPIVINEDNFKMQGIPVSQGVAKGFVRVAFNLEEASHLKPGEILLTYSTDIGWTPYFPSLAGVVTELGGLISHGAVVSREYGLPCIAGLHGATRQFQTGDYVLLDGNKGILQKLSPPE